MYRPPLHVQSSGLSYDLSRRLQHELGHGHSQLLGNESGPGESYCTMHGMIVLMTSGEREFEVDLLFVSLTSMKNTLFQLVLATLRGIKTTKITNARFVATHLPQTVAMIARSKAVFVTAGI